MGRLFIAGGKAFLLDDIEWSDKSHDCDRKVCQTDWERCEFAVREKKNDKKCRKTLISHCCKHVIKGGEQEQEQFWDIAKKEFCKERVFSKMLSEDKQIIDIYEGISKKVLETTKHVGISADGKRINYFCTGAGKYQGFTNYISLERNNAKELLSVIISTYLKDVDIKSYCLINCLYVRDWLLKGPIIEGAEMLPVMEESTDDIDISVTEALARGCGFFPAGAERRDIQYGALMYFYSFPSEKILSFYESVYKKTKMCTVIHYEENREEVSKALRDFMIRDNLTYRNRVISFFLNEIKPLDWSWYTREEKENAMINYKLYLEKYVGEKHEDISAEDIELLFVKKYLEVEKYNCTKHIANGWDRIIDDLQLVEEDEKTMFNIIDFSIFYIVSSYTYFFIALYVRWILQYDKHTVISQAFRDDIEEWKKGFGRIINIGKEDAENISSIKRKFSEWQTKFDQLYRLEEPRSELLELLSQ